MADTAAILESCAEAEAAASYSEAFRLTGVGFCYPDSTPALSDVSLTVRRGERIAILGANGSGKSTLLKIMNGLVYPTDGEFYAFGARIDSQTLRDQAVAHRFRRHTGFVFQNSDAQLFSSTVREEIAFGPLQLELSIDEVEQRIADVAGLLGIAPLLDRPPYRLSSGEKKKVAIASVLVINPDAILLDEPTAGLDPRSQRWLIDLLCQLNRAGKTLVTATHDLSLVAEIADRAVVLNERHGIERDGSMTDVLRDSEMLLGVNLIHEHVHWHGDYCHSHPHFHDETHDHHHHSHEEE